jgi:hydrocephalus-inducing protein
MLMKNVSEMAVTYEWAFLEEEIVGEEDKMNLSSTSQFIPGSIPINEVFDILPLSGRLDPGQI